MTELKTLLDNLNDVRNFVKNTPELHHNEQHSMAHTIDEAINHITKQFALFEQFQGAINIIQQLLPPVVPINDNQP